MSKELLFSVVPKDFRVDYYRPTGNGGQKVNKTSSAVRITHLDSGSVGACQDNREQSRNKKEAFKRCVESDTFKKWHRRKSAAMMLKKQGERSLEQQVEQSMQPKNLKVEVKENDRWVAESPLTDD